MMMKQIIVITGAFTEGTSDLAFTQTQGERSALGVANGMQLGVLPTF